MRLKNLILILAALATVAVVAGCGQSGGEGGGQDQAQKQQQKQQQEKQETPDKQVAPQQGEQEDSGEKQNAVEPPSDDMMKLTVPKMEEIKDDEIPTGLGTDETLFHDYAGVHIKNTGFPWEEEANVYIAGHRLGFPGTDSSYAFYDLNELEEGDEIYITDSEGRKYTYVVFKKVVATPDTLGVLAPIEGKNIVTLQTCTLPDYVNRILVRGELTDISES